MMGSTVASGGFRFRKISVGGAWYWSIDANNIQGANQQYYVRDIQTPFGRYTDGVDVPIPGDVVTEMASSLAQFQQQLAPLLAVVAGQQTTLNVTVTQGDPASAAGAINIVNAGAFGSFMTASATPTVPWLSASPTVIPGIGQNQQAQFTIILDPTTLVTAPTPYTGVMNLQDNRATPTIIPITVNVTVLPQPVISPSPLKVGFSWTLLTAANSGSQQLIITNTGPVGSILGFNVAKVQNNSPWLQFSPPAASGIASGGTAIITLSLVPFGIPQIPGCYFETILISSPNASNSPVAVQVELIVTEGICPPPYGAVEWRGGDYSGGPGPPFRYGPGNQPVPGSGWGDPPAPGPNEPPHPPHPPFPRPPWPRKE